ncbi:MAG TPA: CoA transferase, partial [Chloroflexota bacterium]|nr:CoA transferase [Chloroflexota bacterium]
NDPGYDFTLQALGGLMSVTGQPDGEPTKVGVAVVDVITGLFASTAILAALRSRDSSGAGQQVDLSLLESELAALVNVASGYLASGVRPRRHGNAHASIVPYQAFLARDRPFALAAANDRQFQLLCETVGGGDLAADSRFATNPARVANRAALEVELTHIFSRRDAAEWVAELRAAGIPCASINNVDEAFVHEQVRALDVVGEITHPTVGELKLVRSPMHLSATPATIRHAPPTLGQHTDEVLTEVLELTDEAMSALRRDGVI